MTKKSHSMKNVIQLSFGEEVGNAITHGVMAFICLSFLRVAKFAKDWICNKSFLLNPS